MEKNDQSTAMPSEASRHERFANRFEGFRFAAAHDVFWPVFVHAFGYSYREPAPLNAIEEGLLRLVQAGVNSEDDARQFLGIGRPYFGQIVDGLCERATRPWPHPLRRTADGKLEPGETLLSALGRAEKSYCGTLRPTFCEMASSIYPSITVKIGFVLFGAPLVSSGAHG